MTNVNVVKYDANIGMYKGLEINAPLSLQSRVEEGLKKSKCYASLGLNVLRSIVNAICDKVNDIESGHEENDIIGLAIDTEGNVLYSTTRNKDQILLTAAEINNSKKWAIAGNLNLLSGINGQSFKQIAASKSNTIPCDILAAAADIEGMAYSEEITSNKSDGIFGKECNIVKISGFDITDIKEIKNEITGKTRYEMELKYRQVEYLKYLDRSIKADSSYSCNILEVNQVPDVNCESTYIVNMRMQQSNIYNALEGITTDLEKIYSDLILTPSPNIDKVTVSFKESDKTKPAERE